MKFHTDTIKLVDEIISQHWTYQPTYRRHYMKTVDDLSLNELCASILKHNPELANESTCCDNPSYEKLMLPALLNHLSDISDKDKKIEFVTAWQEGIYFYLEDIIENLVNERKESYGCAA